MEAKKILVVDDERDLRDILLFNLRAAGYQAEAAYSAEEALRQIQNSKSSDSKLFDLLLLDVMMPGMSGFELAKRLKEELEGICNPRSIQEEESLVYEGLVIDAVNKTVSIDGNPISLTRMTDEVKNQFILRTNAQAHRLTTLLQDISTLNRMDYAKDLITMERVNISALFADIAQETSITLENRQMVLHNYLPQDIIVQGNYSLLYSIFRNLMDNAINYAGAGTIIEVSAEQQPDCWRFAFKDNGIGIPEKHLPRIFERFYRLDTGRSREMGGTGLGLSIVKNAVLLHGGHISVSTPVHGGLAFEFTIKK